MEGIWAARWMGHRGIADSDVRKQDFNLCLPQTLLNSYQVPPFEEVYDGTTTVRAKKYMKQIPTSFITPNDVVVIEATITRWPVVDKDEQRSSRFRRQNWDRWRTEFRLQSVWQIYRHTEEYIVKGGVSDTLTI